MTPHEFAKELVGFALKTKDVSSSCAPPSPTPRVATQVYDGWSFSLDVYEHPVERLIKLSVDEFIFHYRFSAKLYSPGRLATGKDWEMLGTVVHEIALATGDNNAVEPLVPIEVTQPINLLHWMWHSDGSAVDPRVYDGTAKVVAKVQSVQRAQAIVQAEQQRRAAAQVPKKYEAQRNEPCPCGSGKKFKRCHGGGTN